MYNIFWNLIVKRIIVAYLNNILIFTQTLKDHQKTVHKVLEVLVRYKLFLCPEKCKFDKKQVEYLGLVISQE